MEREAPAGQAQAGVSGDPVSGDEDDVPDSCLDVSSNSFDPLLALYSSRTPLPFPEVRCFNNLAEYESFLQGGGRGRGRARAAGTKKTGKKGRKPAPDPDRVERLKKLMVIKPEEEDRPPRRRRKPPKNVLTRMPLHEYGPLGMLYRCVQERLKVNVHIRTFKGLRGVCSGFVVAFDKFWNMAMVDVDETYRKPVFGKAFYNEPQLTLTRLFDRLKLQESELQSSTKTQSAVEKTPGISLPHHKAPYGQSKDRRTSVQDPSRSAQGRSTAVQDQGQPGISGDKPKLRTRWPKEKIDYQKVYKRHIKQLFVRGESIVLVHLQT
ncbi:U7 snRNA-associated Sm-like protein LSm11 isoform X1 [Rana temporaria]|uniref:U7 snRNA-associated Sm-like protein LSm11 isoform X1 n=1 Tax=Rana temporaria TaxID=8407 RepID=UPI001AAE0E26|nr:U7 snRNA-associated Sm-like protein LSm11 isoform X1 [Rana temporaria]